jgi:retinol dehydrogenase 12
MAIPPHLLYVLRSITAQSFFIPSPSPPTSTSLPSLSQHDSHITGGYTGLGYEVASLLYAHDATVWIAGRSEAKAAAAIERLQTQHPASNGRVFFLKVDFSDLSCIRAAVEEFVRRNEEATGGRLDWLDNNAGVMVPPQGSKGKQGHDLQLVTNVYGPFLFTKLLLPVLRRTAEREGKDGTVRVSWAGSAATFLSPSKGGVGWEKDGKDIVGAFRDTQGMYLVTKAWNWWLAKEFGRRYGDQDGVLHNVSGCSRRWGGGLC